MGVKIKTKKNKIPEMRKNLKALGGLKVQVGVMGEGKHVWLARIHEYGMTIHAKKGKYLTVPLCPEASGEKARSFKNTWVYTSKKGNKFIVQNKGDNMKFLYWLTESVVIPERAFLRNGYAESKDEALNAAKSVLCDVISGNLSIDEYGETVGDELVSRIQEYTINLNDPPNSPITVKAKGSDNPLNDTGQMIDSIGYEVIKG